MYASKSFCQINSLVSNSPGVVSPIGEMTPDAQTYSREVGVYRSSDLAMADYTLFTLKSANSDGTKLAMPATIVNEGIAIVNRIKAYVSSLSGQVFDDELRTQVLAFAQTLGITTIDLGNVVQHGSLWYPDWVKWTSTAWTGGANENTIWLSNSALALQYTDFEIVVVPPVDALDNFFQSYVAVQAMVAAITLPQTMERIQTARSTSPQTVTRTLAYNYFNPANITQTISTNWSLLIYGPAGDNVDSIKDALVAYILAHSTRTRTEWTQLFPDIFKRTEFILAPHWYQFSIAPRTINPAGIYSPNVHISRISKLLKDVASSYDTAHVDLHTSLLGAPYESVAISVVGGKDNRNQLFELAQVFPDYANIATSSPDFNRMSQETQQFCAFLGEMLPVAEGMTEFTDVPSGYTKLKRDNSLYLVKSYNNIQFLVVSKTTVDAAATTEGWLS